MPWLYNEAVICRRAGDPGGCENRGPEMEVMGETAPMRIVGMNSLMAKVYSPECGWEDVRLPRSLNRLIEAGVVIHEGCYVLAGQPARNAHLTIEQCQDRTGYESLLNHIHLRDHGDDRLPVAFAYLRKLSERLQSDFPGVEFVGVISSEPNGQNCVVRFYKRHPGERPMHTDNLEDYELDAVCLLDLSS